MAALGRSLARAVREGAKTAALGLGRRIAHRAAEGHGPVARFSTIPGEIYPQRLPIGRERFEGSTKRLLLDHTGKFSGTYEGEHF